MENTNNRRFLDKFTPVQTMVIGYGAIILAGTLLLTLPIASTLEGGLSVVDALFTATSAMAVTGLIVVDTAKDLTTFGQVVILLLIQIGGLGLMTISTFFAVMTGRRIGLKERLTIMTDLGQFYISGMVKLVRKILLMTFAIEGIGALLLFLRFNGSMPLGRAIYFGVFHSISAFCNAGFALFSDNLEGFIGDPLVNLVIAGLFILGGLGFVVISELYNFKHGFRLSLHTKLVLRITLILILVGTVVIFLLEIGNPSTLKDLSMGSKVLAAFFQAVTPRTAGFNTLPMANFRSYTLFFIMILMFIGASPGSTGGGIKTTTFGAIIMEARALILGSEDLEVEGRRLPIITVLNAFVIAFLSISLIAIVLFILLITEDASPLELAFETVSAFGTVGLSTGITPHLGVIGKLALAFTMFSGRLGPMTIALAVGTRMQKRKLRYRYPEEKIMIG